MAEDSVFMEYAISREAYIRLLAIFTGIILFMIGIGFMLWKVSIPIGIGYILPALISVVHMIKRPKSVYFACTRHGMVFSNWVMSNRTQVTWEEIREVRRGTVLRILWGTTETLVIVTTKGNFDLVLFPASTRAGILGILREASNGRIIGFDSN